MESDRTTRVPVLLNETGRPVSITSVGKPLYLRFDPNGSFEGRYRSYLVFHVEAERFATQLNVIYELGPIPRTMTRPYLPGFPPGVLVLRYRFLLKVFVRAGLLYLSS